MRVLLEAPAGFSFRRTVLSHGWCTLLPFRLEGRADALRATVALPDGRAASIRLAPASGAIALDAPGRLGREDRSRLEAAARRILALDLDLREFHALVSREPAFRWIAETGTGRLLRAPTVFEDLVKLVLTTNCSWSLTTTMVRNLVTGHGAEARDGSRAFPDAARLAKLTESDWRERVRCGYRAPHLVKLCRDVALGRIDPESWASSSLPASSLRRVLLEVPGVGPYVAENLLKFLGRPDGLALDSWMRAKYGRMFHGGRRVTDRTIARRAARLGPWAGLALWFVLTADWLDGDDPSEAWESLT